jgi:predicted dehydrogenase
MALNRKLRMGMVGGGRGAFIGAVHRMAASLDGRIELVAGCFSSDPERSRLSGRDLYLDPTRVYGTWQDMVEREAALPRDRRIDFVSIVTRNDTHVAIASAFLAAGFHVVCDKPLGQSLAQGLKLRAVVRRTGKVFALTHNYTGYPMVKEARDMVRAGRLGTILKVVVEYPQGYALRALGGGDAARSANWRTDPAVAGASNCMADIGTHAENLSRYITGLEIEEVCAELSTFIPGRALDDDGNVLVRYKGGAKGVLYASQISNGEENGLTIRAYGTKSSLEWHQEHPNELLVKHVDGPQVIHRRGHRGLSKAAQANTRLPGGHPEAFIEAFANVYLAAAEAIADEVAGRKPKASYDFPTVDDGVTGMAFVEAVVRSSRSKTKWTRFPKV